MKKRLIALAVAGAMTSPMIAQADASLYSPSRRYQPINKCKCGDKCPNKEKGSTCCKKKVGASNG